MTFQKNRKSSFSPEKILNSLENSSFRKVICGASNTDEKQVERLSLVYSLCGFDVIDISPYENIYNAAKRGIIRASEIAEKNPNIYGNFSIPAIMKSINVGNDKHFRKADFNFDSCIRCMECVKICQSGSLSKKQGEIIFNREKCYGCARCVEVCKQRAVRMTELLYNRDIGEFDAIEIHTGNSSIEEVKTFLKFNKNIIERSHFISVSVDSMRFNNKQLVEYVNSLIKLFEEKIIVQIDGVSMRGGIRNSSTIQAIAAAATLLDAKTSAYIQVSGGTNHLTQKIIDLAEIKVSGIAYGTFAKKIILSYIEERKEDEFLADLQKITGALVKLANPLRTKVFTTLIP